MEKLIEAAGPYLGSLAVGGLLSLSTLWLMFRFLNRVDKVIDRQTDTLARTFEKQADALTRIAVSNEAIRGLGEQTNRRLDACIDGHQMTGNHLTRIEGKLDGVRPNGAQRPPFPVV